ncbi:MAG: citramalate synthase [Candidatus Omnitrophica bacterium]|nr:citramalate synthase [Candidatus Omnitrophota bacterium]
MKKQIFLYDTTLRDGAQTEGISLSLEDKLKIAVRLDHFGIHYIEGGWPGSNPKDLAFFTEVRKLSLKHAKIAAFGSTRRAHQKVAEDANIQALLEAKTKTVTIFGKSWDLHVTDVFRTSLKENLSMIHDSVAYLKDKKLEVIYDAEHFFDGFKNNPEYAVSTCVEAAKAGADVIVLCDTNGGSLNGLVAEAMDALKRALAAPLGIHCHNDMNLAVVNSVTAVERGAIQVQGTINGYGERCGNADLTSVAPILQVKLGYHAVPAAKLCELTELSRYVAEVCNMPLRANQPFVGTSAFAHKGGVHIDAMAKNLKTYEHCAPETLGNQRKFLVSELSGKTNILLKTKQFNVDLEKDAHTKEILSKIRELENEGYQFEAAEASFELVVRRLLGKAKKFFEVKKAAVRSENIGDASPVSVAEVKILAGGREYYKVAEGDGPVNALDRALREALRESHPLVDQIHLTDYKVRVVNSQAGTAAKVRVFIEFCDEEKTWTTVGVNENIIEASWQALIDAIEYKLYKG